MASITLPPAENSLVSEVGSFLAVLFVACLLAISSPLWILIVGILTYAEAQRPVPSIGPICLWSSGTTLACLVAAAIVPKGYGFKIWLLAPYGLLAAAVFVLFLIVVYKDD